jgi:hypothetical protein
MQFAEKRIHEGRRAAQKLMLGNAWEAGDAH